MKATLGRFDRDGETQPRRICGQRPAVARRSGGAPLLKPHAFRHLGRRLAFTFAILWSVCALLLGETAFALSVSDTTANGLPAYKIQWTDSLGLPRTAIMIKQGSAQVNGSIPQGVLYSLTYQTSATATPVVCSAGSTGYAGEGFVQNHIGDDNGDSNNNQDNQIPGSTSTLIYSQGAGHAIIAFSMPKYYLTITTPGGMGYNETVPTTIYWLFADGRTHPIYALTQDARGVSAATIKSLGGLAADTRSPYGGLNYDGSGNSLVGGASYGDTFKFVTLASKPEVATINTGWIDTAPNTIPYAMSWANPAQADAEMGHVATVPITVQDQGSDPKDSSYPDPRGQKDSSFLNDGSWAYQILNETLDAQADGGASGLAVGFSKLAWGGNFGRVGGFNNNYGYGDDGLDSTQFSEHWNSPHPGPGNFPNTSDPLDLALSTRVNGMLMAYSVFIVLGPHSGSYPTYFSGAVGQQVVQMENAAAAKLSASTGGVTTSGPAGAGINASDPVINGAAAAIQYTPAGYNPTYATWEIDASGNAVNAILTPAAGQPLVNPVFVVNNYTLGKLPASIAVGAGHTVAGTDYFATVDTAGQRLWITVNRSISGALNLVVTPTAVTSGPVISSIPFNGTIGTPVVITGQGFTGATSISFNGVNAPVFTVNSDTQITVTVPAGATPGPISVTTPKGTGVSAANFTPLPPPTIVTGTWTSNSVPLFNWAGVASSADGVNLVAVANDGHVYTSANEGASWNSNSIPGAFLTSVASSVDGSKLVAGNFGLLYLSSNNGSTWNPATSPSLEWFSVASSTDGSHLAGVADFYVPFTSPDQGSTWVSNNLPRSSWVSVASSADGSGLIAFGITGDLYPGGGLYTSADGGTTWVSNHLATSSWSRASVASSADGSTLVVASASLTDQSGPFGAAPGSVYVSLNAGATWQQSTAPTEYWDCVACSSDGSVIVAASYGSPGAGIYTSRDFGATWTSNSVPSEYWSGVACSSDGTKIVAAASTGQIYTFAPGPGGEIKAPIWTPLTIASYAWDTIAGSFDGAKLVAAASSGEILSSTNAGLSWTPTAAPTRKWLSLASSSDGGRLAAAANGAIYTSPDSGATWTLSGAPTNLSWFNIVASTSGTKLLAIGAIPPLPAGLGKPGAAGPQANQLGNLVYSSTDAGAIWSLNSLPTASWSAVASSADGTKLVAVANPGQIYVSTNSGATWLPTSAPTAAWTSVASSADGTRLSASTGGGSAGRVYLSTNSGATWTLSSAPLLDWTSLSSSQDGTHLVAISGGSGSGPQAVYTSIDGGVTWAPSNLPSQKWVAALFTGNGNALALVGGQQIYLAPSTPDVTTGVSYINKFPTGGATQPFTGGSVASWVYWYGLGYTNVLMTNDPAMDAGGDPASGSLKVHLPFGTTADQGVFFGTFDNQYPYDETVTLNATYVTNLGFDIHFAPGTPLNSSGNLGVITMSIFPGSENGGDFYLFPSVTIPASATNGWFHATESVALFLAQEPLSGLTNCDAIGFDYNSYGGYPTQPVTFWIDNVAVNPPVPKALPVVSWATPSPIVYGTALSSTQLAAAANVPGIFTYSPGPGAELNAGAGQTLTVTFTPSDITDYLPVTTNVMLNVTPALLTVTANNGSRAFGQPNPAFTSTISGFVNGDTASVVSGAASLTTTASSASPVGSYPIVAGAGTLSAANYAFTTLVNGSLTVTPSVTPPPPLTWGPVSLPNYSWDAVAASTNGIFLVVAAYSGQVFVSTNSGKAWTAAPAPGQPWVSVASSADGSHLAAVSAPKNFDATMNSNGFNLSGVICVSANGGATWTITTAPTNMAWVSIASSSDGTKLAAVGLTDSLALLAFNSADSGATWISNTLPFLGHNGASPSGWASIASSADGSRLVVAGDPGWIYTSTNAGFSWNTNTAPDATWTSVASSADGLELVAVNGASGIYISPDGGVTWNQSPAPSLEWTGVASSPNGANLIAVADSAFAPKVPPAVYASIDAGGSWVSNSLPSPNLIAVASGANGSELLAVDASGVIYMSPPPPARVTPVITWPAPAPIVYGTPLSSLQLNATANVPGTFAYSPPSGTILGAGPVQNLGVAFTPSDTADYAPVGINVLLNVKPAPLTVTANNASRAVGQANPAFTATITGFVNGDTVAAISGQASLTTTATQASPSGNYPIVAALGALTASNYTFTSFVPGTLTVAPAVGPSSLAWAQANLPLYSWDSVAVSANGAFLVAASSSGEIFTSGNSGAAWASTSAPFLPWAQIACSADGSLLAASVYGGAVYTSANGGSTWSPSTAPSSTNWLALRLSADGSKLVAVATTTNPAVNIVYVSTNAGGVWLASSLPPAPWVSADCSADGTKLVAASSAGQIYISTNAGASWTPSGAPLQGWISVACSGDGRKLAAATQFSAVGNAGRQVFTSVDGGATWSQTSAPQLVWTHVSWSEDGSLLAAVSRTLGDLTGSIFTSSDAGATWGSNNVPNSYWSSVGISSNGAVLVAVGNGIYLAPASLIPAPPVPLVSWTSNSVPFIQWAAVASDASGTNLVGIGMNAGSLLPVVYHSTNEGLSWISRNPFPAGPQGEPISYLLNSVASSSDGTKLVVGALGGWIYLSPDSGTTWRLSGAPTNFYPIGSPIAVASSADGTHLAAAGGGMFGAIPAGASVESIYTSSDSGATWTANPAASAAWTAVAMSANGTTIAAVGQAPVGGIGIYSVTTDGGATWSSNTVPDGEVWLSIASSADGTRLAAGSLNGPIYTSTNAGATWAATGPLFYEWTSIASSADGSRLVAGSENGQIFISTNAGGSWILTGAPVADWVSVASSSDGSKMVAVSGYQQIYTLQTVPPVIVPPAQVSLAISFSATTGITISWPSSAAGVVLQQTSSLSGKNWTPVGQTPVDNGVTKQVVITPGAGMVFYRLAQ